MRDVKIFVNEIILVVFGREFVRRCGNEGWYCYFDVVGYIMLWFLCVVIIFVLDVLDDGVDMCNVVFILL